ncbi:MAG: SET domain-containing protein [Verrucomicrobia bacterium]|nr:SET domain-containing protein [Verrucomicrobiota bacterium]
MEPFKIVEGRFGKALVAMRPIPEKTILFGGNDWWDEEERKSFIELTPAEVQRLDPSRRRIFLKYAYNHHPTRILGTLDPNAPRHPSNFLNHSCEPNTGYDLHDHVVTLRDVDFGEELTMDYGTFTFSFDQEFLCGCGTPKCRRKVTGADWKQLVHQYGYGFPSFMHDRIREIFGRPGMGLGP